MAQVVPSLTSLPMDSTAAPSAEDIQARLPSICVDYLSHDWAEEDVWASWRSMTRHKNEIANGVRLENASWRTWWKQRNKLKTISPETLNWLKDSDVTWLYGPLHTAVEPVPPPKIATAEDRLGIVRADSSASAVARTKPILKHRTLSEMLSIPNPSSPILEAINAGQDVDEIDMDGDRPLLLHTKSDTNIVTKGHHQRRKSPPRGPIQHAGGSSGNQTPGNNSSGTRTPTDTSVFHSAKRHISFNTFVEQCIAVDDPSEIAGIEEDADERHFGFADDDDDDDQMLEMRSTSSFSSSRSTSTRGSRPSLSRSSTGSTDHMTIAMIAPTTLKTTGVFPSPSPQVVYAPTGHYAHEQDAPASASVVPGNVTYRHTSSSGYPINPAQGDGRNHIAPRSIASPTWDDEDDYSVGFDYFSGPDLGVGDEYDTKKGNGTRAVQTHVGGTPSYGRGQNAPTVGQAPPQPKWRVGTNAPAVGSGESSATTSGTSTPRDVRTPKGTSPPVLPNSADAVLATPAQPGRSILKIRPPGSREAYEPDTSPTNTHFNWKPSAATGLGGLDQGVRRVIKEPAAGSLPLYDAADSYFQQPGTGGSGAETPPLAPPPIQPTSPAVSRDGESRGRSVVRTGIVTAERSASRGVTTSTPSSISPSSSRLPASLMGSKPTRTGSSESIPKSSPKSSSTPSSPPLANETPQAEQVQQPVGLGGVMPKDDVEMKKEENAKKEEERRPVRPEVYVPDRGGTPTPHSSPQVVVRPLMDTSPASLPHAQTIGIPEQSKKQASGLSAAEQSALNLKAQNSVAAASRRHQRSPSIPISGVEKGSGSGSGFFKPNHQNTNNNSTGEDDHGLISNIASTAKDLLGALWTYSGQQGTQQNSGTVGKNVPSAEDKRDEPNA